jgi:hypothetical protein
MPILAVRSRWTAPFTGIFSPTVEGGSLAAYPTGQRQDLSRRHIATTIGFPTSWQLYDISFLGNPYRTSSSRGINPLLWNYAG